MTLRLQITQLSKRYGQLQANDAVSLRVQAGEVHAVLGENGAGKSTLMKMIYGVTAPDSGEIAVDAQVVRIANPQQARALGISMVFQHFSLFEALSVAQNVWLGLEKSYTLAQVSAQIEDKAAAYGLDIDPQRPVHTLSVGQKQRVEIIRALLTNPRVLILDEPTSVLTPQAVDKLFEVLRQLAREGCSILYISHKLHEIRSLAESCTVMRAGKVVATCTPGKETNESLARMMMGEEGAGAALQASLSGASSTHAAPASTGPVQLHIANYSAPTDDPFGTSLKNLELQVHAGEIVGVAGVSGNGQQELFEAILQAARRPGSQHGDAAASAHGHIRIAPRTHFVPEERLGTGAVPSLSLAHNLLLTRAELFTRRLGVRWIRTGPTRALCQSILSRFAVKAAGTHAAASSLSGGNLQKYIVGREIDASPQVLVIAQPTWGVDVGAASRIHEELRALAGQGAAVLIVSDELEELFALCSRLYVMSAGELSPGLPMQEASATLVGEWMSGGWRR